MRRALSGSAARRLSAVALAALFALLIPACGKKSNRIETYPVKGKVLVNGQPAKGAHITFHPVQAGSTLIPSAQTDDNGEFNLATYEPGDGAPAGEYDVTIEAPVRFNPISTLWEGDKLNGKYSKKETPVKRITVEARPQELPPFDLVGPK